MGTCVSIPKAREYLPPSASTGVIARAIVMPDQPMSMIRVMELMLPREIRLVQGNERRRRRRRRMMVMLRAKHGCVLLVVLRRPRGRVRCCVSPIPIVVELSGSFMRRRLRRLWGRHVYGCGEGAPVVPVGVAIRIIVLVYGCGMTRAGVVALLALLLGKIHTGECCK